jgi:hypothetical protein
VTVPTDVFVALLFALPLLLPLLTAATRQRALEALGRSMPERPEPQMPPATRNLLENEHDNA